MTIAEIFSKAGMNTLLGMGTVFVMLILISCIISLFRFIPEPGASKKQKEKTAKASAANGAVPAAVPPGASQDDGVLIAVITAAIAASKAAENSTASSEENEGEYIVRSIKRRGK